MRWVIAGLSCCVGFGVGWFGSRPAPPGPAAIVSEAAGAKVSRAPRCIESEPAASGVRSLAGEAERVLLFEKGQQELLFGKALSPPGDGFGPAEVRDSLSSILTVGKLEILDCEAYPCRGVWDVRDADPAEAREQLLRLEARYPSATIGWAESRVPPPAGTVGFIIHDEVDREGEPTDEIGRVRTYSRMNLAEFRYRAVRGSEGDRPMPTATMETWGVEGVIPVAGERGD